MNQLCLNRPRDDLAGWSVLPLGPQQCAGSEELCHGLQSMTGGAWEGRGGKSSFCPGLSEPPGDTQSGFSLARPGRTVSRTDDRCTWL